MNVAAPATALRVLTQLRRDPRTLALLLVVPCLLVTLLKYVFVDRPFVFDRIGGPLLGLFPFIAMFLVASITMLRERMTGTLERLMTLPLAKLDLLFGYGAAFALVAALQATAVSVVALGLLGLDVQGSAVTVGLLAVGNAVLGMSLGLSLSAFARTEFQAVQFMPAFVFPNYLCGGCSSPETSPAMVCASASDLRVRRLGARDSRRRAWPLRSAGRRSDPRGDHRRALAPTQPPPVNRCSSPVATVPRVRAARAERQSGSAAIQAYSPSVRSAVQASLRVSLTTTKGSYVFHPGGNLVATYYRVLYFQQ